MTNRNADCNDWTTKKSPASPVKQEVNYSTVCRGLEVKATRSSYGNLMTSVMGYIGARRVSVYGWPSASTDDQLRAEALALANDLADAGIVGKPVPVEATE